MIIIVVLVCAAAMAPLPVARQAMAVIPPAETPLASSGVKTIEYIWEFPKRAYWKYELNIPYEIYDFYRQIDRKGISGYTYYVTDASDDDLMSDILNSFSVSIKEKRFDADEAANYIISFVQSLDYIPDNIVTGYDEYPKYPVETLYDRGGDCEDTSILLAALLKEMGYSVALIGLTDDNMENGHMGVGIKGVSSLPGDYFIHEDQQYYYIETSEKGWGVGELPPQLKDMNAVVMSI
jgi:hypothetical protein